MIERTMVACEDCAGVGTFEFGGIEGEGHFCQNCDGWGEVCSHCGQSKDYCAWSKRRLECQPPEDSRSPVAAYFSDYELLMLWNGGAPIPARDGPNFRRYNELAAEDHRREMAQATNKKASPQAGE